MSEVKQIGNIVDTGNWDNPQRGRIYSADGICPALNTVGGGGLEPKIIEDFYKNREPRVYDETAPTIRAEREGLKVIVASRGRNPDNPSDRTPGNYVEQRLEPNSQGICNTLTSVQKDNLVLEPLMVQAVGDRGNHTYSIKDTAFTIPANPMSDRGQMVLEQDKTYLENAIEQIIEKNNGEIPEAWDLYNKNPINNGISKTLGADCGHTGTAGATAVTHNYRIRKLTPKECALLMKFTEEDAEKMLEVNSNTQVYKQCGNSIVVSVLEAIFCQMNIKGCPTWEEYSKERYL